MQYRSQSRVDVKFPSAMALNLVRICLKLQNSTQWRKTTLCAFIPRLNTSFTFLASCRASRIWADFRGNWKRLVSPLREKKFRLAALLSEAIKLAFIPFRLRVVGGSSDKLRFHSFGRKRKRKAF